MSRTGEPRFTRDVGLCGKDSMRRLRKANESALFVIVIKAENEGRDAEFRVLDMTHAEDGVHVRLIRAVPLI